jgi:hypothetical protein
MDNTRRGHKTCLKPSAPRLRLGGHGHGLGECTPHACRDLQMIWNHVYAQPRPRWWATAARPISAVVAHHCVGMPRDLILTVALFAAATCHGEAGAGVVLAAASAPTPRYKAAMGQMREASTTPTMFPVRSGQVRDTPTGGQLAGGPGRLPHTPRKMHTHDVHGGVRKPSCLKSFRKFLSRTKTWAKLAPARQCRVQAKLAPDLCKNLHQTCTAEPGCSKAPATAAQEFRKDARRSRRRLGVYERRHVKEH